MRTSPATLILARAFAPALAFILVPPVSAAAQGRLMGPPSPANVTPRLDLSLGFEHQQANAPPGVSNDFGVNGGFAGAAFHFNRYLAAAAEFSGGHANNISALGQNLTLTTYMAGPRVTFYRHRVVPFGEALFGGAHGSDSYFPSGTGYTTSATSFAYSAGGGVDVNLSHRFAIRALEAQFLHTAFNNGSSNVQRHLMIGAGVVIKFGGKVDLPPPPPAVQAVVTRPQGDIHFTCSLNKESVNAGDTLLILGNTMTEPDHLVVTYTWQPDAGMITGTGREVKLDTTGVAPGSYKVHGHAAVTGDYTLSADCEMPFAIAAPAPVAVTEAPPPPPAPTTDSPREQEFHANVPDAYFDYNSAVMRQDARAATTHAAAFLHGHPDMRVRVEGFADERGSVEYNLILGQQRAEAARNGLIAAGLEPSRIEIVSFGKGNPVCAEAAEECYRKNRRAAFSLHP